MAFNLQNNHPIIPREQNYILDRKLLTVHSEDRDINKWPYGNNFEIILPESYTNIQSMRLVESSLPCNYYTFSNEYQNTKLVFQIKPLDPTDIYYPILAPAAALYHEITIQEGFYDPEELANELTNKMNNVITDYLASQGLTYSYEHFNVYYDKVGQKYWFGNVKESFILVFNYELSYDLGVCKQPKMWEQYTNWGLPSYLGFKRESYDAIMSKVAITFDYLDDPIWIEPATSGYPVWYVTAPLTLNILGDSTIYMEVEKYNSYDELRPYSEKTTNMYNNDYTGIVKSAFAKIPVTNTPNGRMVDSRNHFLQNVTQFIPPLERIQKLKFKFRYHDGRLVDFQETPFNFTIEINQLKNEIATNYNIRVPALYTL